MQSEVGKQFYIAVLNIYTLTLGTIAGVKALRSVGTRVVSVDPCSDPEAAAESAALSSWLFQDLKNPTKRKPEIDLIFHSEDEAG